MTANVDDEALSSILLHLKSNPTVEDSDNDNDDNYNYNNHSSTLDERDFKYRESYVDGVNDNNMEVLKRNQQYDDHQNHPSDRLMSSKKTKHDSSNIAFSPEPTGLTTMSSINTITKKLKISELKKYFHLPINNVSKKLGVCTAVIKKICRHNNIQRWPYRQIKSLSCAMQSLEMASLNRSLGDEERKNMRTQIDCLQESIACIIANPSVLSKFINLYHYCCDLLM